jgi:hypothetical protein
MTKMSKNRQCISEKCVELCLRKFNAIKLDHTKMDTGCKSRGPVIDIFTQIHSREFAKNYWVKFS